VRRRSFPRDPSWPRQGTQHRQSEHLSPLTETFFSLLPAKNPSHWPSGEKKGEVAASVPGMGLAPRLSIARK